MMTLTDVGGVTFSVAVGAQATAVGLIIQDSAGDISQISSNAVGNTVALLTSSDVVILESMEMFLKPGHFLLARLLH